MTKICRYWLSHSVFVLRHSSFCNYMHVFVYEYASAQPLTMPLPASIRREGRVMLEAALADFGAIQGVTTSTLKEWHGGEEAEFKSVAAQADWSFIIAPELDGLLEERCRWVEEAGGRLLGPSWETLYFLADKSRLPW